MDWTPVYVGAGVVLNWLILYFWQPWTEAYAGEKGKNLARKEDLTDILAEVRAIAFAQKEIESKLAGDLWQKQNVWNEKKNIYASLLITNHSALETLTDIGTKLGRLAEGQTVNSNPEIKAELRPHAEKFGKGFAEIIRLQSAALLFTSPSTMNIITAYLKAAGGTLTLQTRENVQANIDLLIGLNVDLVASAKVDLGIEPT